MPALDQNGHLRCKKASPLYLDDELRASADRLDVRLDQEQNVWIAVVIDWERAA
jgi:hypothetical protein